MRTSWKSRALSRILISKAASQTYVPAYPEIECRKVRDPVACQACLCRPEITDKAVRPNRRHNAGHHEDRTGQYRLQHAPLPLPGADQREGIAIQRGAALDLLKTQIKNEPKEPSVKSSKA